MDDLTADYGWVEQVQTVDAIDVAVVEAINNNPGWRLIGVGTGSGGQTTLTYGWPWPGTEHSDCPGVLDVGEYIARGRYDDMQQSDGADHAD